MSSEQHLPIIVGNINQLETRSRLSSFVIDDYLKLPEVIHLYAGIRRSMYNDFLSGNILLPDDIWTPDEGRAECCAYLVTCDPSPDNICFLESDKLLNIVVQAEIPKRYITHLDDSLSYFKLDIALAVQDQAFHTTVFTESETPAFEEFMREETWRRFH